jgi:hypothetical protein
MFSTENLNSLVRELLGQLNGTDEDRGKCKNENSGSSNKNKIAIHPSQALVIAGLIGGVFEVTSVLVDKNQLVQIILTGSLKQKTQLEKMMDQVGSMPFDEVMKDVMKRFK